MRTARLLIGALAGATVFAGISYLVRSNAAALDALIVDDAAGMATYALLSAAFVMIPLGSPSALIPIASTAWGWAAAGALTLVAWTLASLVLFEAARRLQGPFARRLGGTRAARGASAILEHAGMPALTLLRVILPSDIASYLLALCTDLTRAQFLALSIPGLAIPAFWLAYAGSLPLAWQIVALLTGAGVTLGLALAQRGLRDLVLPQGSALRFARP